MNKDPAAAAESLQLCLALCDPWTVAHQTPLSMGFSRQECWSGLPFPSPENLPDPEIEPASLMSPASAGSFLITSTTWNVPKNQLTRPSNLGSICH